MSSLLYLTKLSKSVSVRGRDSCDLVEMDIGCSFFCRPTMNSDGSTFWSKISSKRSVVVTESDGLTTRRLERRDFSGLMTFLHSGDRCSSANKFSTLSFLVMSED